jgi:glutamate-1-semialdehyde 2,1-aminomutase
MEYRRLGKTPLQVSAVGFGTAQLRLTPENQAIDTLLKGFDLGVNIIHTAPDYGNAVDLISKALNRTNKKIIIASQGYDRPSNENGPVCYFESLFESTCACFGTDSLDLYGIACIDDREIHKENVWGKNGMVDFLLEKKAQGRLGAIYCSTHGSPEYVKKLICCGVFDAIMIAYNILGYHLLSCSPPPDRHFESLDRSREEIFPLCREHQVGLMIMKPFGGGLLCRSHAFPPLFSRDNTVEKVSAADVLRSILVNPEVSCVLPGTASVMEAEENAKSGYVFSLKNHQKIRLKDLVDGLKTTVCSRCGHCDNLCSQDLPISWIFRAALINLHPSAVFEQLEHMEYFKLHPQMTSVCADCRDVSCRCPNGIDIPLALKEIHEQMLGLVQKELIPPPENRKRRVYGDGTFGARIVSRGIPEQMVPEQSYRCRINVENAGLRGWHPENKKFRARAALGVFLNKRRIQTLEVTRDVHKGDRFHFEFEIAAPLQLKHFRLRLQLLSEHQQFSEDLGSVIFSGKFSLDQGIYFAIRSKWRMKLPELNCLKSFGRSIKPSLYKLRNNLSNSAHSSDSGRPYGVGWIENNFPNSSPKGKFFQGYIHVENQGSRPWLAQHPEGKSVYLVIHIDKKQYQMVVVPHDVSSGESVIFGFPFTFPDRVENEKWQVSFSLVEQNVAWFDQEGVIPLDLEIQGAQPEMGANADAVTISKRANWGFWQPGSGITHGWDGRPYPVIIKSAKGCRIRDLEENEWIDYVMCGGAALLGYAHPEISGAISRELQSSAVVTLPHVLEIRATELLCDMIPCAEMVLFGKHGSDACTTAIRIARLHTGRKIILYSGYHGWHDWYAETMAPKLKMTSEPSSLFHFPPNDLPAFHALAQRHSGNIAAVMIEPAAQTESLDGPVQDADPSFLREIAQICKKEQAVLIFDEMVTGFRYPQGSVQKATGVIPDLACFGKALSAGMALSALVGKSEVMQKSVEAAYFPTFRGEVYSLAAAVAALQIYKAEDIPGQIEKIGSELKEAINNVSLESGMEGEMIGLPFRMIYRFNDSDIRLRSFKRTLLQQELLKGGILTFQGYMLPSIAHGEQEKEKTTSVFRAAFKLVNEVSSKQQFARYLELPLL